MHICFCHHRYSIDGLADDRPAEVNWYSYSVYLVLYAFCVSNNLRQV